MTVGMIKGGFSAIQPIDPLSGGRKTEQAKQGGGFGEVLQKAIGEVDHLQKTANQNIEDLILGKNSVNTHDAMIALEKADTAFQLMNNVRAKIIRVYEEVLRTQV